MSQTAAEIIVDFARRRSAPPEVLRHAQRILLSGLRSTLAASDTEIVSSVVRSERDRLGGAATGSSVLWSDARLPADEAAATNALAWSLLLLDDIEPLSGIHPGGAACAAALAVAERDGVSGPDLLAAIAVGIEVQVVMARGMVPELLLDRGFAPLSVVTPLGAAATAVALGQVPEAAAPSAIGMAAMSGIGVWEMGGTGSAVGMVGSAVKLGLGVARLAGASLDAPPRAIEGDSGAFRAYCGKDPAELMANLARLGEDWTIGELWYTPFSGDTYSQAPLEAMAELRRRADAEGEPGEVERITVLVAERVRRGVERKHARFPEITTTWQLNSDPPSRVAAAWLRRVFSYGPGFTELVGDADVRALRDRAEFVADDAHPAMDGATVQIDFAGGTSWCQPVPAYRGSQIEPASDDDLTQWFTTTAGPLLSAERIERTLDALWSLDRAESVGSLIDVLRGAPAPRS